ncbi:MAG TPA: HAD-IIIA family hydrolase [Candidatus Dormibacteraeota bacterium]|nr:HAD-IIIA family hydrolase [Candidatus Dormibacteraeota bacterium]
MTATGGLVDVVIPTIGRESLGALLRALDASRGPLPERVIVVDDRRDAPAPLALPSLPRGGERLEVLRSGGGGPAAARNVGWRAASAPWVAFLDDDTVPSPAWLDDLVDDLATLPRQVAASQGRIVVPLPSGRRATDWERNVHGLESATWATADMAYRRTALAAVGGFDERFRHAYREDADLALRVRRRGWQIERGRRHVVHPVRPAGRMVSVRLQRGNADDVLMRALHGAGWRAAAHVPRGRRRRHAAISAAAVLVLLGAATRRRSLAAGAALAWLGGTAELAWARIAPGPRTADEVGTMLITSALLPLAATAHWARGVLRLRTTLGDTRHAPQPLPWHPRAVLFDRDGTLVHDVPYNGEPSRVLPMPGAREAVDRLRRAGVRVGVVSNQSGVGRGLLSASQVDAVNRHLDALLGPFDDWRICPHAAGDGCDCRKPQPGMVLEAARALDVAPSQCVVVGDIGADVAAGAAAGGGGVLVPTEATLDVELRGTAVARNLGEAVDLLLGDGA